LMVVVLVVGLLAFLLAPDFFRPKVNHSRINCVNNLKQVGLSFRLWSGDNGDRYPAAVSTNNGGVMELVAEGRVSPRFAVLSNELCTPKIINCRSDDRSIATGFASLHDTNISYFVCLAIANEAVPNMWRAGDRNVTNGSALIRGVLNVETTSRVGWTEKLHKECGNLCLVDGSVQQLSSLRLLESLRAQTNSPLRLAVPQ